MLRSGFVPLNNYAAMNPPRNSVMAAITSVAEAYAPAKSAAVPKRPEIIPKMLMSISNIAFSSLSYLITGRVINTL